MEIRAFHLRSFRFAENAEAGTTCRAIPEIQATVLVVIAPVHCKAWMPGFPLMTVTWPCVGRH